MFTKNSLDKTNFTELTPVRLHKHEVDEKGLVHVLVPKFTDPILGKILQPRIKDKYIKADFDKFGSALWLFADGKNKIDDIVREMKEKFGEEIEPAYNRITLFLQQLHKNKLIYFQEFKKD